MRFKLPFRIQATMLHGHAWWVFVAFLVVIISVGAAETIEEPLPTTTITAPPPEDQIALESEIRTVETVTREPTQIPQTPVASEFMNEYHHGVQHNFAPQHQVSQENFTNTATPQPQEEKAPVTEIVYSQPLHIPDEIPFPRYAATEKPTEKPKIYYYTNPYLNNTLASKILAAQYQSYKQAYAKQDMMHSNNYKMNDNHQIMVPSTPKAKYEPVPPIHFIRRPIMDKRPDGHKGFQPIVPSNVVSGFKPHQSIRRPEKKPEMNVSPWKPVVPMAMHNYKRPTIPINSVKVKDKPMKPTNTPKPLMNMNTVKPNYQVQKPTQTPMKTTQPMMSSMKDGQKSASSIAPRFTATKAPMKPTHSLVKPLSVASQQVTIHHPGPHLMPVPEVIEIMEPIPQYYTVYKEVYVAKEIPIPKLIPFIIPIPVRKKKVVTVPHAVPIPKPHLVEVPHHVPQPVVVPIHKPVPVPIMKPVKVEVPVVKEEFVYVKKPFPVYVDSEGKVLPSEYQIAEESKRLADNLKQAENARRPMFVNPPNNVQNGHASPFVNMQAENARRPVFVNPTNNVQNGPTSPFVNMQAENARRPVFINPPHNNVQKGSTPQFVNMPNMRHPQVPQNVFRQQR